MILQTALGGASERKEEKAMSLRKMAKILETSPTYVSLLLNGKRKWPDDLRHRYSELVNTNDGISRVERTAQDIRRQPTTSYKKLAGVRGSRTLRGRR